MKNIDLKFEVTVNWKNIGIRNNFFDAFSLFWTEIIKLHEADACQCIILADMDWMHNMTISDGNVRVFMAFYEIKKLALDCGLLTYRKWEIPPDINPLPTEADKLTEYYVKLKDGIDRIGASHAKSWTKYMGQKLIEGSLDPYMPHSIRTIEEKRRHIKQVENMTLAEYRTIAEIICKCKF